jgi:acetyl esterase/lipase
MIASLLTFFLTLTHGADASVTSLLDIPYVSGANAHPVKHKLDLYLPKDTTKFPVIFFVHGGAWVHGDKNFLGLYSSLGRAYAKKGIGVVVTNYRLSPSVQHPEHARDVGLALAWTQQNIAKYGGDPSAITLCGHSAGGHLVSLVACSAELQKDCGVDPAKIRAVAPISGVYNIPGGFLPLVFGTTPRETVSPTKLARPELPPFLVLFGQHDLKYCGKDPSTEFCDALCKKGNKAMAVELSGADHMFALLKSYQEGQPAMEALLHLARTGRLLDGPSKP